jgi:hypothetical protein
MYEHIPFGLKGGMLVDVHDVPRGAKCQCICPSCKTPLVARHGNVKQWHFAHASRAVHETTKRQCDYSFYVSVRLMSRQVFDVEAISIDLPEYTITLKDRGNFRKCTITPQRSITLDNIVIEKNIKGIPVDVVAQISGYPFAIYFIHQGRSLPCELYNQNNMGVITIDLTETRQLFKARQSYLSLLQEYIKKTLCHKQWIFHPREVVEKNKAMTNLSKLPAKAQERQRSKYQRQSYRSPIVFPAVTPQAALSVLCQDDVLTAFQCQRCESKWEANRRTGKTCERCQTHIYSIEISLT